MGVVADPAQAHSLRILASPDNGSRWQSGTHVPPDFHTETTPSGQGPLVHAHLRRYHVARGSSSGGAGAQGRGPNRVHFALLQTIRFPHGSCLADWVRMRRTGVRPLYAVCQSERSFSRPSAGARRDCPPRVGPRPGSAWHMGTRSMARLTHRNASAGEALLWVATIPPPALAAGSGPPSILSLVPFPPVTHAPPSILRACPGPCLSVTRLLRFLLRCSSSSHSTLRSQPSHQQTSFPVRESRRAGIANITCDMVSGPAWPHILAARG